MTPEEADRVRASWRNLAARVVGDGSLRLLYDARLSRSGLSLSGALAVNDRPGRSFSASLSDDFGLRIFGASWDGGDLIFDRSANSPNAAAAEWRRRFSGAISPRSLSLLFVGLPDDAVPESVTGVGDGLSLFWNDPAIRCDLDPGNGRPRRASFGTRGERVEVSFAYGSDDVPSALVIDAQSGGRVSLRLVSLERGSS